MCKKSLKRYYGTVAVTGEDDSYCVMIKFMLLPELPVACSLSTGDDDALCIVSGGFKVLGDLVLPTGFCFGADDEDDFVSAKCRLCAGFGGLFGAKHKT